MTTSHRQRMIDTHAAGIRTALIHRLERGSGEVPSPAVPVPTPSMTADLPAWLRLVGLNAACALGVALLVALILGVGPFLPTLLSRFSNAIGIPAALILPAQLACHRGPGWRQWVVLTGGLLVVGAGGSLVAAGDAGLHEILAQPGGSPPPSSCLLRRDALDLDELGARSPNPTRGSGDSGISATGLLRRCGHARLDAGVNPVDRVRGY